MLASKKSGDAQGASALSAQLVAFLLEAVSGQRGCASAPYRASDWTPAAGADAHAVPVAQEGAAAAAPDTETPSALLLAEAAAAACDFELPPMPEATPQPAAGRARARREVRAPANSKLEFALTLGLILGLGYRVLADCAGGGALSVAVCSAGMACARASA